jgi:tetratricopeptide (TPR) repeat protein
VGEVVQTMKIEDKFEEASKEYDDGNVSRAEDIFKEIVQGQPDNTAALYFLSELSFERGDYDSAAHYIRMALQYDPENAEAQCNLGFILLEAGRFDDAEQYYLKALEANPHLPEAYLSLGNIYKEKGQFEDAIRCYQKALQLNPDAPEVYSNLGIAYQKAGRHAEAAGYFETAVALNPDDANMHYNLGIAFQENGRLDEAIQCYQKASQRNPGDAGIYNNLAFALQENRRPYEAIPYYRKALQLEPSYATAHWNLSLALLLTGNFREGWREYEWRWGTQYLAASRRNFVQPLWSGEDIKGRTILLHAEQGFGDTIQFIRYVSLVAERGAGIIFECCRELAALLLCVKGIGQVVVRGEKLPAFDVHCPLLSLPLAFDTTLETIPAIVPYVAGNRVLTEKWKAKIKKDNSKIKIGFAWAGNPGFKQNRYRNIPLALFLPLTKIPGAAFYSLQKGGEAEEAKHPPGGMKLFDYTEDIHDFSDTASLIENLDLIISVDTAIAHLAGALGKPVWTLLPFSPEWRWLLDREDTPWYPTMKLFRQSSPGDWRQVIDRVRQELSMRPAAAQ